jgi:hypothetical protein
MLAAIREEGLDSPDALLHMVDEPIDPDADDRYAGEEYVIVRQHGPGKLSLNYFRRSGQQPITFIVTADYVKAMITLEEVLDGYEAFDTTPDEDHMQDRTLGGCDLSLVEQELERLGGLAPAE